MILAEMLLECIVIDEISWIVTTISSVAHVAAFMSISAMCEQLVVSIKSAITETAFRMALEPALVYCTRIIIAILLVLPKLWRRK